MDDMHPGQSHNREDALGYGPHETGYGAGVKGEVFEVARCEDLSRPGEIELMTAEQLREQSNAQEQVLRAQPYSRAMHLSTGLLYAALGLINLLTEIVKMCYAEGGQSGKGNGIYSGIFILTGSVAVVILAVQPKRFLIYILILVLCTDTVCCFIVGGIVSLALVARDVEREASFVLITFISAVTIMLSAVHLCITALQLHRATGQ
ncbi:unnamed protein product [Protopolystoma xenopodis]|uniref:Transmembrane protein n=1 Tax=Protopolystoma xenopodis TaxID=117903 RepID=A0A3S4ZKT6_9PLAT|nr:unnamed protein product [Protopolystoma xenopodis]